MSDHDRASQGRIARLCGTAKAWLSTGLARLPTGRAQVPADALDEQIRRDIGFEGRSRDDRRTAYYRTLLRRGQPLP